MKPLNLKNNWYSLFWSVILCSWNVAMTVMKCSVGITVIFSSSCAARVVHNTRARRKDNVRAIDLREQCQNKFNLHICSNS